MGIKQDVFGLEQIYRLQVEGNWSTRGEVWTSPSPFGKVHPFGYFGGGFNPNVLSTVDRIDYSNDTATASVKGPLSLAKWNFSATGNQNFGYYAGGANPSATPTAISSTDRIDYTNDTATAVVKGPLSSDKIMFGAVGNQSFGYFGGGYISKSTVDRIDYSNDTATALVRGPLDRSDNRLGGSGNSDFGYLVGGDVKSKVSRIDYSNDTATASPKGPLATARKFSQGTGDSSFGYFAGGGTPGAVSIVDRIDYSNDTATASEKGPLSVTRTYYFGATSAQANAITTPTIFSASTVRENVAPQGTDFGYFAGDSSGGGPFTSMDRIDYSNDTETASPRGNVLTVKRKNFGAVSSASHGYFGGGKGPSSSPSNLTSVDRIDFANDTAVALAKGPLSATRYTLTATGNSSFGYFIGGSNGRTIVDRVDYSNDTATASLKGPLSVARDELAATGDTSFGYFGGGDNGSQNVSIIDRIDYSNDTATAAGKGPLSLARNFLAATSAAANALPQ